MKTYITAICIAVICCALPSYLSAQSKSFIKGTVSDSAHALSFATIRLYKPGNPVALQTQLGKEDGSYQLAKPANGNYILGFSHTGYAEQKKSININTDGDFIVAPVLLLKASGTLNEVVVKAQRPLVEQSDDKVILNVEDDPSAKTETAIDILRKTPFVTVDGEDNIKINGKSNFRVLLNGRETAMFASNVKEALRGFPGTTISKIEVITNPSAKYDGEGIGGLINIITKKKIVGYNGSLSTFNRSVDKVNHYSLNGNAKLGKFGLSVFMNKGYSDPITIHSNTTTIPLSQSVYTKRVLDGDQRTSGSWQFGNAELSWDVDSLHTLSVYTNLNGGSNTNSSDQYITTSFENGAPSESHFTLYNRSRYPSTSVGTDFIKHYKKNKDREFSLRFLGSFGRNSNYLNSFQDNPGTDRYLINESKAINNEYTVQADNSMPVKWGKFDAGLKAIIRRASSDFGSMVKYAEDKEYEINPSNTNNFTYRQDVVSVYSMLSFKMKKNSFRVGGRVEYTDINGDFTSSNTVVNSDYISFLPNVQMTRKLNKQLTLVLNYNKRISRPFINDLNPFVINNDSLNISYGNPDLGPQNIHSFSTQFRYLKNGNFAGLNLEGSYSGNRIIPYSVFDPQTGITKTTSLNIGKEYQASVNLNMNRKFSKRWTLFTNASLRYIHLSNNTDDTQRSDGVGVNFNLSLNYKVTERFNIASFVGLAQEARSIQTRYPFNPWHNISFNYKVFKNKINISLRAVNYYEKYRDFETETFNPNFTSTTTVTRPRRAAVLALTWNFGKLTEQVSKKKGVNNDDLLSKPQTAPTGN
jgi:outer membrane cobalamin receptor